MKIEKLLTLFPESYISSSPLENGCLSFPWQTKWVHIPAENLSEREKQLAETLLVAKEEQRTVPHHPWARYLLGESNTAPAPYPEVQLIQFWIRSRVQSDSFSQTHWLAAFREMFCSIKEGFFLDPEYGLFVVTDSKNTDFAAEMNPLLNLMEDDFGVRAFLYIGQAWPVSPELPRLFQEEQAVFSRARQQLKGQKILSLSSVALPYYTGPSVAGSRIVRQLKAAVEQIEDSEEIITALWQNQGNITKAATALFIHRNTLQYRIDRFFEATGLQLKLMDDLLLAYLVIHAAV